MKLLHGLSLLSFFLSPVLSHNHDHHAMVLQVFNEMGLSEWANYLSSENPDMLEKIVRRNDITVFAPTNEAVIRHRARFVKLGKRGPSADANVCHTKPIPNDVPKGTDAGGPSKRRRVRRHIDYPDTNFETIYTFLDDPQYVNLGPGNQVARFVKNYAAPSPGDSLSPLEVVAGLGDTQRTLRGPYKFKHGIIYEVSDFFTLPHPFSDTMEHMGLGKQFYHLIIEKCILPLFEDTPAITIFVPVDNSCKLTGVDPKSHILWGKDKFAQYMLDELMPGQNHTSVSGAPIEITWAKNGERLVNGRRIVKPNVAVKNGVVHFVDGPLDYEHPCNKQH